MRDMDLNGVSLVAARLQNGYAYAIDTRDWAYFETLFTPDVEVEYAVLGSFAGMAAWLGNLCRSTTSASGRCT